jgi:zinc transport system substrate-binding protein
MKLLSLIIILILLLELPLLPLVKTNSQPIKIAVSLGVFVPVVRDIGGTFVNVFSIVPSGVEPHEFTLAPGIIQNVSLANLIIIDGHIEWETQLLNAVAQAKGQNIDTFSLNLMNYASNMTILNMPPGSGMTGKSFHGYWLLPSNMEIIAKLIYDKLIKLDPAHSDYYYSNLNTFLNRLSLVENKLSEIKNKLGGKPVVLGFLEEYYIAHAMGLKVVTVLSAGENPNANPNALSLAEQVLSKEQGIIMISDVAEQMPLYATAKQLSQQTGAPLVKVITTIDEDYVSAMMYNIGEVDGVINTAKVNSQSQTIDPMFILLIGLVIIIVVETFYIFKLRRLVR